MWLLFRAFAKNSIEISGGVLCNPAILCVCVMARWELVLFCVLVGGVLDSQSGAHAFTISSLPMSGAYTSGDNVAACRGINRGCSIALLHKFERRRTAGRKAAVAPPRMSFISSDGRYSVTTYILILPLNILPRVLEHVHAFV